MIKAIQIDIMGKVQGVGFRPFVWKLAKEFDLKGKVWNHSQGVSIQCLPFERESAFLQAMKTDCPPLARIDQIRQRTIAIESSWTAFSIVESVIGEMITHIAPDAATCPACLMELQDQKDRRYQYPFLNCTHCGPRFSIIEAMPYDRPNTVMKAFPLCPSCDQEYHDPANRRFHAQPVACPKCGPSIFDENGKKDGSMIKAVSLILSNKVVAVKGIGGFHFACLATSDCAVQLLRQRKHRASKPFAVMMKDIAMVERHCRINDQERVKLTSMAAPIVLLEKRLDGKGNLSEFVAPDSRYLGVMLPSTPLHHRLLAEVNAPLVMTSGNPSGLPPVLENDAALAQLAPFVDGFLLHDRPIVQRLDDSIVQIRRDGSTDVLRRARGYVPDALPLPKGFPNASGYLALGSDLKASFALGYEGFAIVSQYLGDLATLETQSEYARTIEHFLALYNQTPLTICEDAHPGYFNRQWGVGQKNCRRLSVFHHHAHIVSCLGEHDWSLTDGKVLAWALDGLGYGPDNTWWGGELLLADYHTCERVGGLPATPLAGGDQASKSPWRSLSSHLWRWYPDGLTIVAQRPEWQDLPIGLLSMALERRLSAPEISSTGRLFDAVAASLGICLEDIEFEGQAAVRLMCLAESFEANTPQVANVSLPFTMQVEPQTACFDLSHFWQHWFSLDGTVAEKAWWFHRILAEGLASWMNQQASECGVDTVVFTGGVCHNRLLMHWVDHCLSPHLRCLRPNCLPSGDGGLAFGQLLIGLASQMK